jgi:hypothetical protein
MKTRFRSLVEVGRDILPQTGNRKEENPKLNSKKASHTFI